MRPKTTPRSKILQLRRKVPENLVFERLDLDPLRAFFRFQEEDEEYIFVLGFPSLEVLELYQRVQSRLRVLDDDNEEMRLEKYVAFAREMAREQFKTWKNLTPSERLSLLITWGEDQLLRAEQDLRNVVMQERPRQNTEHILLLAKDIECWDQYVAGLETAYLALD